ncbi:DUF4136 domain-containing protein [Oceanicoccus sp. KOV_DT_Chl]|uniref:DUF4136 domain-containing protein n=1 Tax=Oceanicoccus sp. KOV_DT_Chl TaxID=1904639 RepID=UPI00135A45A1|nr:DUF4136 domain-containing protein [Oceanicoccus sp. KOV_DT_Chl]
MMNIFAKYLLLVLVTSLTACTGVVVNTDYDTSRNFGKLKHYAWLEPKQKLVVDPLVDNSLMNMRVQRAVERQLAAQGFVKAEGDTAVDFLITYHVSSKTKLSVDTFHAGYGYYPCWGCFGYNSFGGQHTTVREYQQGTFMLDVVDPANSGLIWRGIAGRRLSETRTPQERDVFVDEIVTAILAKFPPTGKTN